MQQAFEVSVVFLVSLRFIPSIYTSRLNKPAAKGILCVRKSLLILISLVCESKGFVCAQLDLRINAWFDGCLE